MEALGLAKHSHNHTYHLHAFMGSSAPQGRQGEVRARSTSQGRHSSLLPSPAQTFRSCPRGGPPTWTGTSCKRTHARSAAVLTGSSDIGHAFPSASTISSAPDNSQRSPASTAAEAESQLSIGPQPLLSLEPTTLLGKTILDTSPIVGMHPCSLDSSSTNPDTLLVLHRAGLLTAWSLADGTLQNDLDLASSEHLRDPTGIGASQSTAPSASLAANSVEGLAGAGNIVTNTLAVIRSHTSSPAPVVEPSSQANLQYLSGLSTGGASLQRPHAPERGVSFALPVAELPKRGKIHLELLQTKTFDIGTLLCLFEMKTSQITVVRVSKAGDARVHFDIVFTMPLQNVNSKGSVSAQFFHDAMQPSDKTGKMTVRVVLAHLIDQARFCRVYTVSLVMSESSVPTESPRLRLDNPVYRDLALSESEDPRGCLLLDTSHILCWTLTDLCLASIPEPGMTHFCIRAREAVAALENVEVVSDPVLRTIFVFARCQNMDTAQEPTQPVQISVKLSGESSTMEVYMLDRATVPANSLYAPSGKAGEILHASVCESNVVIRKFGVKGGTTARCDESPTTDQVLYLSPPSSSECPHIKGLMPLSMERIVVVHSSGHLSLCSLNRLILGQLAEPPAINAVCTAAADPEVSIKLLKIVINPRQPASKRLIAGFSSGDIAVWDPSTLKLQAEWSLFTTAVTGLTVFGEDDNTSRLNACLAVSAQDGSLAILTLEGLKMLYLIPGRGEEAPLEAIAVRVDDLMLSYADGRARVWDVTTQELRRSIGKEQALSLLNDGAGVWTQHRLSGKSVPFEASSGVLSAYYCACGPQGRPALAVNLRKAIDAAAKAASSMVEASWSSSHAESMAHESQAATLPKARPKATPQALAEAIFRTDGSITKASVHKNGLRVNSILRPLLAAVWPAGIDKQHDATICSLFDPPLHLEVKSRNHFRLGLPCLPSTSLHDGPLPRHLIDITSGPLAGHALDLSSGMSATILLACHTMLNIMRRATAAVDNAGRKDRDIEAILDWTTEILPSKVPAFQPPSLSFLACHLIDATSDIRLAASRLFEWRLANATTQEIEQLSHAFRKGLPALCEHQPEVTSAHTLPNTNMQFQCLVLLGYISIHLFKSQDPALLKDIARSILETMQKGAAPSSSSQRGTDPRKTLLLGAINLSLEGFGIWQNYVDAMDLLRNLFILAMLSDDEVDLHGLDSIRSCARKAVIKIAEEHTPLFMTTLHLDMLQAASPSLALDPRDGVDAKSQTVMTPVGSQISAGGADLLSSSAAVSASTTMRLVAFMARRRPRLLFPNLPRLAEAVVKSLDPTQPSSHREALLPAATIMIGELVSTFGTISFHRSLQRLAIGTHEGAIVLYDMRSATRLFVLEGGHSGHSLDAISFSPDGRRLVSVSHREGRMLGWKVGNSVVGWFKPGLMPRQGGEEEREGAYKCLRFPRATQSEAQLQQQLWRLENHQVRFEWQSDKVVKVELLGVENSQSQPRVTVVFDVS